MTTRTLGNPLKAMTAPGASAGALLQTETQPWGIATWRPSRSVGPPPLVPQEGEARVQWSFQIAY